MKAIYTSILLIVALIVCSSFHSKDKKEKYIRKSVSAIWKQDAIMISDCLVPDSLLAEIPVLKRVTKNGKTLGYACYATAFGCRVGGCAAPGNPNVQSYETFDYVVLYSSSLSVLRVDVVNFSGEYGYEICRQSWLKQFVGKNGGFVLNENIDGITGATVSAQYLIDDLNVLGSLVEFLCEDDSRNKTVTN